MAQIKRLEILKDWKFHLNLRGKKSKPNICTVNVIKHWHRLPREVLESPSLEILKPAWSWPWATCCSWPCLSRGVGLGELKGCLLSSAILWHSNPWCLGSSRHLLELTQHKKILQFKFIHVLNSFHDSLHNQLFHTWFDALHKAGKSSCFGNSYWQCISSNQLCKSTLVKIHAHTIEKF